MKTKAQIIQELLEKKAISVEEAMTLMMADENTRVYIYPTYPTFPQNPYPFTPYYYSPPFTITDYSTN